MPLPESRRSPPKVDGHIEDLAVWRANQFRLHLWLYLVMQSAQHVAGRERMIVLHEVLGNAQTRKYLLVVTFQKEPAFVLKDSRLQHEHVRN